MATRRPSCKLGLTTINERSATIDGGMRFRFSALVWGSKESRVFSRWRLGGFTSLAVQRCACVAGPQTKVRHPHEHRTASLCGGSRRAQRPSS